MRQNAGDKRVAVVGIDVKLDKLGDFVSSHGSAGFHDLALKFLSQPDSKAVASLGFTQHVEISCRNLIGHINTEMIPRLAFEVITAVLDPE